MDTISRNIILDLLPVYIAGEASEETRALIEEFATTDPQIAGLLRAGALPSETLPAGIAAPEHLEVKTLHRVRRSIRRQMWHVAIVTASVLLIPLIAMQFSGEVNWSLSDFIVMGVMLSGTGLLYVLISRMSDRLAYRAAVGIAVVAGFLLIWINLAVGIIGSEDHPANTLYFGVLIVGLLGAGLSRFRARGMAIGMFATATAQLLVPLIALVVWSPAYVDPPGLVGVFMLNAGFAALFVVAGMLFRRAARPLSSA
jgi:hypothetical protein